jgi:HTH-type transcriptional regulator / antitoxin HigA
MKTLARPRTFTVPDFADLPDEYGALCRDVLLPRPIRDRTHYRETVAVADALAGHRLNRDQSDYFSLLCDLIESWDHDHQPAPSPAASPLDVLRHLMEAHHLTGADLTGADLARLLDVSPSLASRLLSGERQLTAAHIATLARRFNISPAAFVPV